MRCTTLLLFCLLGFRFYAQPLPDWDISFGTTAWDELHIAKKLPNDNLLLGGNIGGWEYAISDSLHGGMDYWLTCTDNVGNLLWNSLHGGEGSDRLWDALPLDNGRFLLIGDSDSAPSGNKQSKHFGGLDYWVLMLDAQGNLLWENSYGSSGNDRLFATALHQDGGFVLAGFSDGPADGLKTTPSYGGDDLWILRISETGDLLWQTQIGGNGMDNVYQIHPNKDGSFLLAGSTSSNKNDHISQVGFGENDFWLLKINEEGQRLWDKRFGGKQSEQAYKLLPLRDGHFLLGGASASVPFGKKRSDNHGGLDFWVVKVTPLGDLIWEKSYGGTGLDALYDIVQGEDGSLYFVGVSDSPKSGNKASEKLGGYDFWLLKTDEQGNWVWDETYGGEENDAATQLLQFEDGALLLAGHSSSAPNDQKTATNQGVDDIWLFKTACAVDLELPNDRLFCQNTEQTIEAFPSCQNDCKILWNGANEGFDFTFLTSDEGEIRAQIFDQNGCTAKDTFAFDLLPPLDIDLGADTATYETATVTLIAPAAPNSTWQWSTGDQTPYTTINESGIYSVTVTDKDGCTGTDTIDVCLCIKEEVYIPNVFNPENTSNYANERWYISAKASVISILDFVEIYSVQGHLVFSKKNMPLNSPLDGWDGRTRTGHKLPSGVYTFRIGLTFESGKKETRFGTVTLVR